MIRPDNELAPVIAETAAALSHDLPMVRPGVLLAMATVIARRLDLAGLLEEAHCCAAVGCTEPAEMTFMTCRPHRGVE